MRAGRQHPRAGTPRHDLGAVPLDPARQRLFRLLGLHAGTSIDGYAAAALAATSVAEAAGLLDGLHGEGLPTETGHRRYGMRDLLRRYGRDHAAAGPAPDAREAVERLMDYYQHAAARAEARLARQTRPGPTPAAPVELAAVPDLDDDDQALAWARAERASLLACLDHAATVGQDARVIALTAAVAGLLRHDGPGPTPLPATPPPPRPRTASVTGSGRPGPSIA
jgi:hypothetical protein